MNCKVFIFNQKDGNSIDIECTLNKFIESHQDDITVFFITQSQNCSTITVIIWYTKNWWDDV